MGIRDNLMAFWKLDEADGAIRVDCVGANDLANINNVTQIGGRVGDASHFTRALSQNLARANPPDLTIGPGESFTIATWLYLDSKPGAPSFMYAIEKYDITGGQYYLRWLATTDQLEFSVWMVPVSGDVAIAAPPTGSWHFVVCWYDFDNDLVAMQMDDGAVVSVGTAGNTIVASTADFCIGRDGGWGHFWDGRIDATGFWKRVLSPAERTYLYNGGAGREICIDFDLTPIGGGLYPMGMDVDADGDRLYLALYHVATGQPVLLGVDLPLTPDALADVLFDPGAGDAINVRCTGVGDKLAISGRFSAAGNDSVQISEDEGVSWTDIAPNWGDTAQPLLVSPDSLDNIAVALQAARHITETFDGGALWYLFNPAVGYSPVAAARLPVGDELIVSGSGAGIDYSPNRGHDLHDTGGPTDAVALEVV